MMDPEKLTQILQAKKEAKAVKLAGICRCGHTMKKHEGTLCLSLKGRCRCSQSDLAVSVPNARFFMCASFRDERGSALAQGLASLHGRGLLDQVVWHVNMEECGYPGCDSTEDVDMTPYESGKKFSPACRQHRAIIWDNPLATG